MASLIPDARLDGPPGPLLPVADGVWEAENTLLYPGGVVFRGRMTVLRLDDGGLLLYSPIPIDDTLAAGLAALGPVTHVLAPNGFHHLFAPAACARYPDARAWRSPALRKTWAEASDLDGDEPWPGVQRVGFEHATPRLGEQVLFHRASGTVVCADLMFHVWEAPGWLTPLLFKAAKGWRRPGQSLLWRATTRDRGAAGRAADAILAWPVERVAMGHGRVLDQDPHQGLADVMGWMRRGRKALPAPD